MVKRKFTFLLLMIFSTTFSPHAKSDIILSGLNLFTTVGVVPKYQQFMDKMQSANVPTGLAQNTNQNPIVVTLSTVGDFIYKPIKDYPYAQEIMNMIFPTPLTRLMSHLSVGRIINILNDINNFYFVNLILDISIDGVPYLIAEHDDGTLSAIFLPLTPYFKAFLQTLLIYRNISPYIEPLCLVISTTISLVTSPYFIFPTGSYLLTSWAFRHFTTCFSDLDGEEAEEFYRTVFYPAYIEERP